MKKKRILGLFLATAMSSIALCSCAPTTAGSLSSSQGTTDPSYVTITSETNGTTVSLLTEPSKTFVENYSIADYTVGQVAPYADTPSDLYPCITNPDSSTYCNGTEQLYAAPAVIAWDSKTDAPYYTLYLSTNADMSEPQTFVTFSESVSVEDLFMGTTYYYQVYAHHANSTVKSRIFSFQTEYAPRILNVPGVSNLRDFGGYYTEDKTKRIKQGIVYRGAKFDTANQIDEATNKMLNYYGLKTDLDLRLPGSESTQPFGDAVNYINVSGPHYVEWSGIAFYGDGSKEALATEVRAFANPDNFPIYVHCSLGRDRTGTICFLINALCGVSKQDLFLDYEISYLSNLGSTGWNQYNTPPIKVYQFEAMYQFLNEGTCYNFSKQTLTNQWFDSSATTMADRVAAYLKGCLGITDAEIAAIRANMLEEV